MVTGRPSGQPVWYKRAHVRSSSSEGQVSHLSRSATVVLYVTMRLRMTGSTMSREYGQSEMTCEESSVQRVRETL